jgi:hypothetical protein
VIRQLGQAVVVLYAGKAVSAAAGWIGRALAGAEGAAGEYVIGKEADLESGGVRPGEIRLSHEGNMPDLGSPKANWGQNSSLLRQAMSRGLPIRDASVDPITGELLYNEGPSFLNAERLTLSNRGWTYDPETTFWLPPAT